MSDPSFASSVGCRRSEAKPSGGDLWVRRVFEAAGGQKHEAPDRSVAIEGAVLALMIEVIPSRVEASDL